MHKVLIYTSAKFVKHVFISLLEMSKVYDLVGQPSYNEQSSRISLK